MLWQSQKNGCALSELDILGDRNVNKAGIDSESWRVIRDKLLDAKITTQNQQGHYLLSVDPHEVSIAEIYGLLREEQDPAGSAEHNTHPWQRTALDLLSGYRKMRAKELSTSLADLFAAPPG